MIIAAYAGAGKSEFAKKVSNSKDIVSMPRRWILPAKHGIDEESESLKAADYLVSNPLYTSQYVLDILKAEKEYDFVIIPTAKDIIYSLVKNYGRNVVVCYPDESLKEEYKNRYLARGNSDAFLEVFYDNLDGIIGSIKRMGVAWNSDKIVNLVMGAGQYLSDLEPQLRQLKSQFEAVEPVADEKIINLEEAIQKHKTQFCVFIDLYVQAVIYPLKSLDDDDDRQMIFELGRDLYEKRYPRPRLGFKNDILELYDPEVFQIVETKEEVIEKVKEIISCNHYI